MSTKLVSQVVVGIVSECHLKGVTQKRHLNSEGLCMSCMMRCYYLKFKDLSTAVPHQHTYKHLIYTCIIEFNNSALIQFLHVTGDHLYDNWTLHMDLSTKNSISLVKMKKTFAMTEGSISLPSSLLAAQNMKEVLAKSCHLVCRDPEETTK